MTALIWKPLALLGGRNLQQLRGRRAADCGKSIDVGLLLIVSMLIVGLGQWLFWLHLPATEEHAPQVAGVVAGVLGVIYLVALRSFDAMDTAARAVVVLLLGTVMVVNALLAGHELVIVAFGPQVQAQGRMLATSGIDSHADALERSLGLPGLRSELKFTEAAATAARAERVRLPEAVLQLQQQAEACDAGTRALQARIPSDPESPAYPPARQAWRQQQARCGTVRQQAAQEQAQHQARLDAHLADLAAARSRQAQALQRASDEHTRTLDADKGTLTTAATTGFARHHALWAAVDAGSVPRWAVLGLMALVFLGDCFCFVIKLLVRDDIVTADARQAADALWLHGRLHDEVLRRQCQLMRPTVHAQSDALQQDLQALAAEAVAPALVHGAGVRAFTQGAERQAAMQQAAVPQAAVRLATAHLAAHRSGSAPPSQLLGLLARMARAATIHPNSAARRAT